MRYSAARLAATRRTATLRGSTQRDSTQRAPAGFDRPAGDFPDRITLFGRRWVIGIPDIDLRERYEAPLRAELAEERRIAREWEGYCRLARQQRDRLRAALVRLLADGSARQEAEAALAAVPAPAPRTDRFARLGCTFQYCPHPGDCQRACARPIGAAQPREIYIVYDGRVLTPEGEEIDTGISPERILKGLADAEAGRTRTLKEVLASRPRCEVTGNLCHTDTRPVGSPCPCPTCQANPPDDVPPRRQPSGSMLVGLGKTDFTPEGAEELQRVVRALRESAGEIKQLVRELPRAADPPPRQLTHKELIARRAAHAHARHHHRIECQCAVCTWVDPYKPAEEVER